MMANILAERYRDRLWDKAEHLRSVLDEFMQLCDYLYEKEECENCPMNICCFRHETIEDTWSEVSTSRLADFLEYADEIENKHCDPYFSQENWEDYEANESRQDFID